MSAESSWESLAQFGYSQARLPPPADPALVATYAWARNVGARAYLWLPVLQDARLGLLLGGWRRHLPLVAGDPRDDAYLALATAVMECQAMPRQQWEMFAAGSAAAADPAGALNAWYQQVVAVLFEVMFVARDAIVERRAPDDEWHRSVLPLVLQTAVMTASRSLATALWPDDVDEVAAAALRGFRRDVGAWPRDWPLISTRAPYYWRRWRSDVVPEDPRRACA